MSRPDLHLETEWNLPDYPNLAVWISWISNTFLKINTY